MTDSNQKTKNKIILFFILIVILMGVSLFVILKINDNSINIDNQDFDTVEEEIDTDDEEIDSEDSGILDNEQIQMDVNKNKISYSGLQVAQNIELFLNSLNQQNGEYYFLNRNL